MNRVQNHVRYNIWCMVKQVFHFTFRFFGRMISCWAKLFSGPENKIVYTMYKYLFKQYSDDSVNNPWLQCIQTIFNSCGLSYVWQNQGQNVNAKMISCIIRQNLQDQFIQQWYSDVNNSSKGQVYRIFKRSFGMENYLNILSPQCMKVMIKFRTTNHHLPVETEKWQNKKQNHWAKGSAHYTIIVKLEMSFNCILECNTIQNIR